MSDSVYGTCALAVFISMMALWGVNLRLKDPTIIDTFWGLGLAMQSVLCISHAHFSLHSLLLASIVCVWGARLSRYLFTRWRKYGADKRYSELLNKLGGNPMFTSLYAIFLAQGLAMWIVALPIQHAAATRAGLSLFKLFGGCIAIAGMLTESLADWQMAKFRANKDNKGKVMDKGLWQYSRHPNYFGSSVFWWGVYLFTAPSIISWTIIAPIYMTLLLVAVTGVPTIESSRKSDSEYQAYVDRTHMFIPWFPKELSRFSTRRNENEIASDTTSTVNDESRDNTEPTLRRRERDGIEQDSQQRSQGDRKQRDEPDERDDERPAPHRDTSNEDRFRERSHISARGTDSYSGVGQHESSSSSAVSSDNAGGSATRREPAKVPIESGLRDRRQVLNSGL